MSELGLLAAPPFLAPEDLPPVAAPALMPVLPPLAAPAVVPLLPLLAAPAVVPLLPWLPLRPSPPSSMPMKALAKIALLRIVAAENRGGRVRGDSGVVEGDDIAGARGAAADGESE